MNARTRGPGRDRRMQCLLDRLEIESRLLESLLMATEEERMALASGSIDHILACAKRKENILRAHESLGVSREHIIQRIPGGQAVVEGETSLRAFVDAKASGTLREELIAALRRLREIGGRLSQLNASNSVLMRQALDWTTRLRSALAGEHTGDPIYTRRGLRRLAAPGGAVVRERI